MAIPVADFTADVVVGVVPLTVQFTDTSTNTPTDWNWDFGAGGPGQTFDQNPLVEFQTPGIYTITLFATNGDGTDEEIKTDYILVHPDVPIPNFDADVTEGEEPLTVTFTDLSADATEWLWDFGDGTEFSTDQNPVHEYTKGGTFTVTLTATNITGTAAEEKVAFIVVTDVPSEGTAGGTAVNRWFHMNRGGRR